MAGRRKSVKPKAAPEKAPVNLDDMDHLFGLPSTPKPFMTDVPRGPMKPKARNSGSHFDINVRPAQHYDGTIYGLYNGDMVAGDRLIRDPDTFPLQPSDVPVQSFMADWVWYRTEEAANTAAAKLQKYLDKLEKQKYK